MKWFAIYDSTKIKIKPLENTRVILCLQVSVLVKYIMRQPEVILRGHSVSTTCVHFFNERLLLSGDESGTVRVWDVEMEECVEVISGSKFGLVLSIFEHDGRVYVQHKNGTMQRLASDLFGSPTQIPLQKYLDLGSGTGYATMCRAASHKRGVLISDNDSHTVVLSSGFVSADTSTGATADATAQLQFKRPGTMLLTSVTRWGDEQFLAGYENGTVCVWDVRKQDCALCEAKIGKDAVFTLCSALAGNVAVAGTGGDRGTLCGLGTFAGKPGATRTLRTVTTSAGVSDISWRSDGRVLVSAGWDGVARVWSGCRRASSLLRPLSRLRWHAGGVRGVAFAPDSSWLATCGDDRTVAVWRSYVREDDRVRRKS